MSIQWLHSHVIGDAGMQCVHMAMAVQLWSLRSRWQASCSALACSASVCCNAAHPLCSLVSTSQPFSLDTQHVAPAAQPWVSHVPAHPAGGCTHTNHSSCAVDWLFRQGPSTPVAQTDTLQLQKPTGHQGGLHVTLDCALGGLRSVMSLWPGSGCLDS